MSWYNDIISVEGCLVVVKFNTSSLAFGYIDEYEEIQIGKESISPFLYDSENKRCLKPGIKSIELISKKQEDPDEWYWNTSLEGLAGKHVMVYSRSSSEAEVEDSANRTIVQGRLNEQGSIRLPNGQMFDVFSFEKNHMQKRNNIGTVKLLWDERYYKPIPVKEIREQDRIVIHGNLCTIIDTDTEGSQGIIGYTVQDEAIDNHYFYSLPVNYGLRSIDNSQNNQISEKLLS